MSYCRTCLKNGKTQRTSKFIGLLTDHPQYCEVETCAACAKANAASDQKLLAGLRPIFAMDKRGNLKTQYVRDETSLKMQAAAKALLAAR